MSFSARFADYDKAKAHYSSIFSSAQSVFDQLGIGCSPPPGESIPASPSGLDSLTSEQLGVRYDTFMQWYAYLTDQVAIYQALVKERRAWLGYVESRLLMTTYKTISPKTDRDHCVQLDIGYVECQADLLALESTLIGFEAQQKRISKNLNQLSRWITIRTVQSGIFGRAETLNSLRPDHD